MRLRVNTDKTNFADLKKLSELFQKLGYTSYGKFYFYSALTQANSQNKNDVNLLSRENFNTQHKESNLGIDCQDNHITSMISAAIKNNKGIRINPTYCAAQYGHYLFDPNYNIYNCTESVGKEIHAIGHYKENIVWEKDRIEKWENRNTGQVKKCNSCKFSLLCGGGCYAKVLSTNENALSMCDAYSDTFNMAVNKFYQAII